MLFDLTDAYFKYADIVNLYDQQGEFWLGKGNLSKFAEFSQKTALLNVIDNALMKKLRV